ncbi:hypothetical protein BOTBODRAFT_184502 [Botryobasidium botryosum FD-172 SS1]|uniref:F-box domain-containing protein n=1 Tax=Botryobasidium botryosum (strain FD-172 SS1) TaxID=930990 RepID=A0A067MUR4_BOTB1|nr:hypothetical protein BOTBODRAFT_184502 [Botryobasidium botryosum FD-172 SS1]
MVDLVREFMATFSQMMVHTPIKSLPRRDMRQWKLYWNRLAWDMKIREMENGDVDDIQDTGRRFEAITSLRRRRNRLAPIHCLPYELLSLIFKMAQDDLDDVPSKNKFLLDISSVSSLWREMTLATAVLWTNVAPHPLPFDVFLARSRSADLTVYVQCETATPHDVSSFMTEMKIHQDRWKGCHLDLVAVGAVGPIIESLPPGLHTLCLRGTTGATQSVEPSMFAGFAPHLRELRLDAIHIPMDSPIYAGLFKLTLANLTFEEQDSVHWLLRALELSPCLSELHLDLLHFSLAPGTEHSDSSSQSDSNPPVPSVSLPYLRILSMTFKEPHADNDGAHRYIIFHINPHPFMQLRLAGLGAGPDGSILPLWSQLRPTPEDAESASITVAAFTELLACHPSLEHISLTKCDITLIKVLEVTGARLLCPLAKSLAISSCDLSGAQLARILASRTRSGKRPCLRRFEINACPRISKVTVLAILPTLVDAEGVIVPFEWAVSSG